MGRTRLVSIAALIAAGSISLAACGSSGGSSNSSTNGAGGGSSTAPADTSSAAGTTGSSSATPTACGSGTISGAGSSAQANAMDAWTTAYQKQCNGATVNYTVSSSGEGVTAFNAGTINFAGSDAALDASKGEIAAAQKQCGSTPLDLPMVVGPVAVAYKLSGVDKLVLDGPTIASIFLGKIKTWDDAAIKKLNPDANLPSTKISPFYRSDSSGTTKNFETYLQATAPSVWTSAPDKDSSKAGFAGQGVAKSSGVASSVSRTDGGIGYVEYSYVASNNLQAAQIDNGSGPVELGKDSVSKAVESAKIVGTGDDLSLKIDYAQKTAGAYPLILVTYEIACTKYKDATVGKNVKAFLDYTAGAGQDALVAAGYVPLPTSLATKVKASIAKIS